MLEPSKPLAISFSAFSMYLGTYKYTTTIAFAQLSLLIHEFKGHPRRLLLWPSSAYSTLAYLILSLKGFHSRSVFPKKSKWWRPCIRVKRGLQLGSWPSIRSTQKMWSFHGGWPFFFLLSTLPNLGYNTLVPSHTLHFEKSSNMAKKWWKALFILILWPLALLKLITWI